MRMNASMFVDLGTLLTPNNVYNEANIYFTYYPGCDAVMTLPNGDPGYPAEASDVDIAEVECIATGQDISPILTNKQWGDIEDYLNENYQPEYDTDE